MHVQNERKGKNSKFNENSIFFLYLGAEFVFVISLRLSNTRF